MRLSVQTDVESIKHSDPHEAAQLLPLVYDDLRRLATHRLAHEPPGQTLDEPTALVHEAYLRLEGGGRGQHWDDRAHFFAAAAEAMRRILVESARRKRALKHGGGLVRRELDEAELMAPESCKDLLALDEALTKLATVDRTAAKLVQLRYFGGLTIGEAARILRISSRRADRVWSYARAWLRCEIGEETVPPIAKHEHAHRATLDEEPSCAAVVPPQNLYGITRSAWSAAARFLSNLPLPPQNHPTNHHGVYHLQVRSPCASKIISNFRAAPPFCSHHCRFASCTSAWSQPICSNTAGGGLVARPARGHNVAVSWRRFHFSFPFFE
jgi:RNA polymerase sigma factor (TIGR02999 family)